MVDARLVMAPGPCTRPAWVGKAPPGVEGRNAVDVVSELAGGLKFGLLKMLNNSARNCNFTDSRMEKFLNREKSRFRNCGPRSW